MPATGMVIPSVSVRTAPGVTVGRTGVSRRGAARATSTTAPAIHPQTRIPRVRMSGDNERRVPELPDISIYLEALESRVLSHTLDKLRLASPFVLRTVDPSPSDVAGKRVVALRRLGKRIVFALEGHLFIVLHLMIAGRLKWLPKGGKVPG